MTFEPVWAVGDARPLEINIFQISDFRRFSDVYRPRILAAENS